MSNSQPAPGAKRRWYHNLKDAFTITRRSYPFITWLLPLLFVGIAVLMGFLGWFFTHRTSYTIYWSILGVLTGGVAALGVLSWLTRKASYSQIEGMPGAAGAVLQQISRGWTIEERPAMITRQQDIVWRLVGRPGVVLVSEGPAQRVEKLLEDERKKVNRVAPNVPVYLFQCGTETGQVPLGKLQWQVSRLKNQLTAAEVPAVAKRLTALQAKTGMPIPRGIDPSKARPDRKGMRGR
ncbi:DUF4191 domain-containing protein [Buchananella felis]|uniref:DUF4191 domain-containing protein n=1 Tax=Buchananella felis TaxID=3231492 RepID=UPI003528DBB8